MEEPGPIKKKKKVEKTAFLFLRKVGWVKDAMNSLSARFGEGMREVRGLASFWKWRYGSLTVVRPFWYCALPKICVMAPSSSYGILDLCFMAHQKLNSKSDLQYSWKKKKKKLGGSRGELQVENKNCTEERLVGTLILTSCQPGRREISKNFF